MFRLLKKAYEAYNEGGFVLFFQRVVNYLHPRLRDPILFIPSFPMITIQSCKQKISTYNNKYVMDEGGFNITPTATDTVIEAGVHRGRDTATFAKLAKQVIAFEPSPRNYKKAKDNLNSFDNVTLINEGLWNEPDHLEIKYGEGRGDDGFLEPDNGEGPEPMSENIPVNTVENYVEELDIDRVDFLKIEAEGAEPEIIKGIGDLKIRSIAVNCGEERDGEPTGEEVIQLLQPLGYELVGMKRGHILFFTLNEVSHSAFRSVFS
jgi:FkbM family methyltransferase